MEIKPIKISRHDNRTVIIVLPKRRTNTADLFEYIAAYSSLRVFQDLWINDQPGIVYFNRPGRAPIVISSYHQIARHIKPGIPIEIFTRDGETLKQYQVLKLSIQRPQ